MLFPRVGLLGKPGAIAANWSILTEVSDYLQATGRRVFCEPDVGCLTAEVLTTETWSQLTLLVVVGGDGSMLNAARQAVNRGIPVVGVNRGNLGFLTDICPSELTDKLAEILAGQLQREERFLLTGTITSALSGQATAFDALNDIVLCLGSATNLIEFTVEIDGVLMCRQRADGVIVTTPTGSTAYSLSAGGPILYPGLSAIALVPMLPHKLTSRPIVINSASTIVIRLEDVPVQGPLVTFDSQQSLAFGAGDTLTIRQKPERLTLIHPLDYDYFATLRDKLHWESR